MGQLSLNIHIDMHLVYILEERAIRIIQSDLLFIISKTLKFKDLVNLKIPQIMCTARNQSLAVSIQNLFQTRQKHHELR